MDFAGQCNDGIFRLSHTGKLKCVVGRLNSLSDGQAHLESGESIQCDLVIVASGLKYNLTPDFLHANLGLGTLSTQNPMLILRHDFYPGSILCRLYKVA